MYTKKVRHITIGPGSSRLDREKKEIHVVLSSDSRLCGPCQGHRSDVHQRFTLSELRQSAKQGCLRCQLLLSGVEKFDYLWQGSTNEGGGPSVHSTVEGIDLLKEEEIQIFINPKDLEILEVEIIRPVQGRKYNHEPIELEFYSHADENLIWPEFLSAGDIPKASDSTASFATIQGWISGCQSQHRLCSRSEDSKPLPSRLVEIGSDNASIRLREGACIAPGSRYTALSHSWGRTEDRIKPVPKTTKDNIKDRFNNIEFSELAKTFEDAVVITRRLGLNYIWIDSLCIIQDDAEDWALQSSRMAAIYENAYVVVAATRSRTGDDGCFSTRIPSHQISVIDEAGKEYNIYVKLKISHREFSGSPFSLDTMPLFSRAWVFQERLLATRVIHYTSREIMWECKEILQCECHGVHGMQERRDWPHSKDEGCFKLDYAKLLTDTDNVLMRHRLWSKIVREYSVRVLAFGSDRMPALSGIAGQIRLPQMGRYLAGIWEGSLPRGLLWMAFPGIVGQKGVRTRPKEYRAPTWSWASVDAEIRTPNPSNGREEEYPCQVLEGECTLVSKDPYGQVESSHLLIAAPAFRATFRHSNRKGGWNLPIYELEFNNQREELDTDVSDMDLPGPDFLPDLSIILVLVLRTRRALAGEDSRLGLKSRESEDSWLGIALRPSRKEQGAYERVGLIGGRPKDIGKPQMMQVKIL